MYDFDIAKDVSAVHGDVDKWDLLWSGHCGTHFPKAGNKEKPLGRAIILHDVTVPEKQHIDEQYGGKELV